MLTTSMVGCVRRQEYLLRLRFNSHLLEHGRAKVLGLWPGACFFSHSCRPTAAVHLASSPDGKPRLHVGGRWGSDRPGIVSLTQT
jgi:hypothetical protein